MGKAFPNPSKTGLCFASELPPRSVGRSLRAVMSWYAMPSQVQECTIPPTPVLLSLWVGACVGSHSLRHRHAHAESSRRGGRSRERTHSLETHKQGATEWVKWESPTTSMPVAFAAAHRCL